MSDRSKINLLALRGANAAKILVSMFSLQLIFCLCLCPAAVTAEITSLNYKSLVNGTMSADMQPPPRICSITTKRSLSSLWTCTLGTSYIQQLLVKKLAQRYAQSIHTKARPAEIRDVLRRLRRCVTMKSRVSVRKSKRPQSVNVLSETHVWRLNANLKLSISTATSMFGWYQGIMAVFPL